MIVKCNIDPHWDSRIEYAISTTYKNRIRKPILVQREKSLTRYYGLHGVGNLNDYKRRPIDIDDNFARFCIHYHASSFHYITLSDSALKENKDRYDGRAYWDYKKMYTAEQRRNPFMVFLTTVLTHELSHAWQHDTGTLRTKYKIIDADPTIDDVWREHITEYDAEKNANGLRPLFYENLCR